MQVYRNPAPVSVGIKPIWRNWDAQGLRMCVEAAGMYGGAAWVWEAYGDGKLMKTKNMTVECDLRTLCFLAMSGGQRLGMGNHFADYPAYRLLENCSWPAEPGEIPEAVQAFGIKARQPDVHPSVGSHEIGCSFAYALFAHIDHMHCKHSCSHSGIFFPLICFL